MSPMTPIFPNTFPRVLALLLGVAAIAVFSRSVHAEEPAEGLAAQGLAAEGSAAQVASEARENRRFGLLSGLPPQNVVLFMADDLDWADLPQLTPPLQWDDEENPADDKSDKAIARGRFTRPDYNRFAARVTARSNGDGTASLGSAKHPVTGEIYPVILVDLNGDPGGPQIPRTAADDFRYL